MQRLHRVMAFNGNNTNRRWTGRVKGLHSAQRKGFTNGIIFFLPGVVSWSENSTPRISRHDLNVKKSSVQISYCPCWINKFIMKYSIVQPWHLLVLAGRTGLGSADWSQMRTFPTIKHEGRL